LEAVAAGLSRRGPGVDLSELETLARARRDLIVRTEKARHEQKEKSPALGRLMKEDREAGEKLRAELKQLSESVKAGDAELAEIEARIQQVLLVLPNLPHDSVPTGRSEADNVFVRHGRVEKPSFAFTAKNHWDVGEALGILDFERAVKI